MIAPSADRFRSDSYVTRLARNSSIDSIFASVLFADVSGFSTLTRRLARQGHRGAELVTDLLNECFGHIIDIVDDLGGEVLDFGGDAVLAAFTGQPPERSIRSAIRAALRIQSEVDRRYGDSQTRLSLRIGISEGQLSLHHVGSPDHRFFVALGEPIERAGMGCAAAGSGEVVVTDGLVATASEFAKVSAIGSGLHRLEVKPAVPAAGLFSNSAPMQQSSLETASEPALELDAGLKSQQDPARATAASDEVASDAFAAYVPAACRWLAASVKDTLPWISELREVSVLFLSLGPEKLMSRADLAAATDVVLDVLVQFGGQLNQVMMDDKGLVMLGVFGLPPSIHDDSAMRAVTAALDMRDGLLQEGFESSVGVASGRAFCGSYGNETRRRYAVVGDRVNQAARFMQVATGRVLIDRETLERAGPRVASEPAEAVAMKGAGEPVQSYRAVAIKGRGNSPGLSAFAAERKSLLGRETELARILQILTGQEAGKRAVVLEGEAGIGKSALLDATIEAALEAGHVAFTGAGDALEASAAYHAWRPIFRVLLNLGSQSRGTSSEELFAHLAKQLSAVERGIEWMPLLNPVLPFDLPDNEKTAQMEIAARSDSRRLLMCRVLEGALDRRSHCLVFDDAHWLDSASWDLISVVCERLPDIPLLLGCRPMGEAAPRQLRKLVDDKACQRIQIDTLGVEAAIALAKRLLEVDELAEPIVRFVTDKSSGHPLHLEEIVHALRDSREVVVENRLCRLKDEAADLGRLNFPDRVHSLITYRLDSLDPSHSIVAKTASVVGRRFSQSLIDAVQTIGLDSSQLNAALIELEKQRLINRVHDGADPEFQFRHALIQEAAYSLIAFSQRKQLHRRVAETISRQGQDDGVTAAVLAHHYRRAEDFVRCATRLRQAGDDALSRGANHEAIRFFRETVELADVRPDVGRKLSVLERCNLERRMGEAYFALGALDLSAQCLDTSLARLGRPVLRPGFRSRIRCAVELLSQAGHVVLPSRWFERRGLDRVQHELASSRALRLNGTVCYHRADALGWMVNSVAAVNGAERAGDIPGAASAYASMGYLSGLLRLHSLSRRYFRRGRQSISAAALCDIDYAEGLYHLGFGRLKEALALFDAGLERSRAFGDSMAQGSGLPLLAIAWAYKGFVQRGTSYWSELAQLSESENNARQLMWARSGIASHSYLHADTEVFERSIRLARKSLDIDLNEADLPSLFSTSVAEAFLCLRRGLVDEAEERGRNVYGIYKGLPSFSMLRPLAALSELQQILLSRRIRDGGNQARLRKDCRRTLRLIASFVRTYPFGRARLAIERAGYARLSGKLESSRRLLNDASDQARSHGLGWEAALVAFHRELLAKTPVDKSASADVAQELFANLEARDALAVLRSLQTGCLRAVEPVVREAGAVHADSGAGGNP